jgi:TetR/AcrR family transcriptional repressor of nem operon
VPRPSVRKKIVDAGPKGSFFNHFKSKESFAIQVLEPYGTSSRIDMLFDPSKKPLDRLRSHFTYLTDSYEKYGFERGCLLGNFAAEMAASHPHMREVLHGIFEQWSSAVTAVLVEAQSVGEIDPRLDPDKLGHFLVNAWEGAVIRMKLDKTRTASDQFFDVAFRLLLK